MIFNVVRPSMVQAWIAANAPGSLKATPRDSWRAFLAANSGVGGSEFDRESSFLTTAGFSSGKLSDRWQAYLAANGGTGPGRSSFQSKFK